MRQISSTFGINDTVRVVARVECFNRLWSTRKAVRYGELWRLMERDCFRVPRF